MAKINPRALPLLEFNTSTKTYTYGAQTCSNYKLLTSNFISILNKVGDCPFVVYCISGLPCIGKSYTLNKFIQHLRGESPQQTQQGGESKRRKWVTTETVGINLWSEPFFVSREGRQIAILLMESQGFLDCQTTLQQNSVIFAHCFLFSSVYIFNCMKSIYADTLHHFHFFTEFALDYGQNNATQGFQKLVFMVRDYEDPDYPDQYGFGHHDKHGAPKSLNGVTRNYYLDKLSHTTKADISHNKRALIKGIHHNFDSIGIILHPDPGSQFQHIPLDDLPDSELSEFVEQTQKFNQLMLSPDYLVTKKIDGQEITGRDFIPYVEHYGVLCEKSKDNYLSELTVAQSMAMMSNILARTHAYNVFVEKFTDFLNSNDNILEDTQIESEYFNFLGMALKEFNIVRKFGDLLLQNNYEKDLRAKCKLKFESLQETYFLKRDLKIAKIDLNQQRELSLRLIEQLKYEKEKLKGIRGERTRKDLDQLNNQTKELKESLEDSKQKFDELEEEQLAWSLTQSQITSLTEIDLFGQKLENSKVDGYERKLGERSTCKENFQEMRRQIVEQQKRQNIDAISAINDYAMRQKEHIMKQKARRRFKTSHRLDCSIL